jgi:hypothetical protein
MINKNVLIGIVEFEVNIRNTNVIAIDGCVGWFNINMFVIGEKLVVMNKSAYSY